MEREIADSHTKQCFGCHDWLTVRPSTVAVPGRRGTKTHQLQNISIILLVLDKKDAPVVSSFRDKSNPFQLETL